MRPALPVHKVSLVRKVRRENPDLKGSRVPKEIPVFRALRDRRVIPELREPLVRQAPPDPLVLGVTKDLKV